MLVEAGAAFGVALSYLPFIFVALWILPHGRLRAESGGHHRTRPSFIWHEPRKGTPIKGGETKNEINAGRSIGLLILLFALLPGGGSRQLNHKVISNPVRIGMLREATLDFGINVGSSKDYLTSAIRNLCPLAFMVGVCSCR